LPDPTKTEQEPRITAADALRDAESASIEAQCVAALLARRDQELAGARAALAEAQARATDLEARLRALESSTIWRATGPVRRAIAMLRRHRDAPVREEAQGFSSSPRPAVEQPVGWYGGNPLKAQDLSPFAPAADDIRPDVFLAQTQSISSRYGHVGVQDGSEDIHRQMGSAAIAKARLDAAATAPQVAPSNLPATYSLITPFYRHAEFFSLCAASVGDALSSASGRAEWIVLNDDPSFSEEQLRALIPNPLRPLTRLISDGANRGIVARLTQGIGEARHPWILFLDCDDELSPETIPVLDHYIAAFPTARYISSAMTDIDETGKVLRPRHHAYPSTELFSSMIASHLKAVRKDLIDDAGGLRPQFEGVQDYDLALRAALLDPILQIPERLYRYRWHGSSQTVAQQARQASLARLAKAYFLREIMTRP
jgi:hypothetical protein